MHLTSLLSPAGYKRVKEKERNERRHETKEKLNGWREAYKCAFLNKTVCFGDHLCGSERMRDREEKGFYEAPGRKCQKQTAT